MVDTEFIDASKDFIHNERIRLSQLLSKEDSLKVFPSNANFFFIKLLKEGKTSNDLFEYLIQKGLMIRNTSTFPFLHGEFFRFSLLSKEENDLLIKEIRNYINL